MTGQEIIKEAVRTEIKNSIQKVEVYNPIPEQQKPYFLLFYFGFVLFAVFKIFEK